MTDVKELVTIINQTPPVELQKYAQAFIQAKGDVGEYARLTNDPRAGSFFSFIAYLKQRNQGVNAYRLNETAANLIFAALQALKTKRTSTKKEKESKPKPERDDSTTATRIERILNGEADTTIISQVRAALLGARMADKNVKLFARVLGTRPELREKLRAFLKKRDEEVSATQAA
ncbi:MAG: hypothetical protein AABY11_03385, partial [archaeon]